MISVQPVVLHSDLLVRQTLTAMCDRSQFIGRTFTPCVFLFVHATDALYGNTGPSPSLLLFSAEQLSGAPRSPVPSTNNAHQWYDSHLTKLFTNALSSPLVTHPGDVSRPSHGPPPLRPTPDNEAGGNWPGGGR